MEQYISEITIVRTSNGDLEAVYAGGKLVIEGHQISIYDLLNTLGFDVSEVTIAPLDDGNELPDTLSDIQQ